MSILSDVAKHVTVGALQHPFGPTLEWDMSGMAAAEALTAHPAEEAPFFRWADVEIERICLVRGPSGEITHYVWGHELGETVLHAASPILPKHCVAASTPVITLLTTFLGDPERWRLVLSDDGLSGFVTESDLFRPELGIGVLALLLDVEQKCAEALCWEPGDAEAAWARLSPGRQAKAKELSLIRGHHPNPGEEAEQLIFCTMFADKAAMVAGLPAFQDLSRSEVVRRFKVMESMRNALAHNTMYVGGELTELAAAVVIAEDVLRRLRPREEQPSLRLVVSND